MLTDEERKKIYEEERTRLEARQELEREATSRSAAASPAVVPVAATRKGNGLGVASLVLGILALFPFSILTGIPAIITGHASVNQKRRGKGMAIAGLIMGWFSLVPVVVVAMVMLVTLPKSSDKPPVNPERFARQMESRFQKLEGKVSAAQSENPGAPDELWQKISNEIALGRQILARMPGLTEQEDLEAKRDSVQKTYIDAGRVLKEITGKDIKDEGGGE